MRHLISIALIQIILLQLPTSGWNTRAAANLPYRITHHDLKVELDLERHYIQARDQLSINWDVEEPAFVDLLLRKGLRVKEISIGDNMLDFSILPADSFRFQEAVDSGDTAYYDRAQTIHITIPAQNPTVKEAVLSVSYEGVIRDSIEDYSFSREYISEEITGVIAQEGVYLGAEAIYYPTLPEQLFSYSLMLTLPEEFQAVSEGQLEQTATNAGKRFELWVCDYPVDAFHIVAGRYKISSMEHNGVRISTCLLADEPELAQRYLQACAGYLDLYNDLLGNYPFKKFDVVENFFATGYGMPTFTLLGSQVLRLPWIVSTSLGHEICHNWWGNSVYVDYQSGNWCEGLTTYCADYLYKERKSDRDAREYRMGIDRDYTAYTDEGNDFPLTAFRERHNPAQRAIGYGKSAMLFHMLRRMVGDDIFWRSLQRFYRDKVWSHASWADIRQAFEEESGENLAWFFQQWVDRTGAPYLTIDSPAKVKVEDGWIISFNIRQKQQEEPYILDIPISIYGASQKAKMRMHMEHLAKRVELKTEFEPISFSIDQDFDIFRRLDRREVAPTLAEVLGARDLIIVLPGAAPQELHAAYEELANRLNRAGSYRIMLDTEVDSAECLSNTLLFLGTPAENRAFPEQWTKNEHWAIEGQSINLLGQEHNDPHTAFLAVERQSKNMENSVAFFWARTAADVLLAGRKLPHYGKYSYLVFYNGKNVAKGTWEETDSPLTIYFKGK